MSLEKAIGPFYVFHKADEQILNTLERLGRQDKTFVMIIVGVPGVGKTLFLRYLVDGTLEKVRLPSPFDKTYRYVRQIFEFKDVRDITMLDHQKRRVWVTLNLDEFVSVSSRSSEVLRGLRRNVEKKMPLEDSIIISGNVGVLGNCENENEDSIRDICRIKRRSSKYEFVRFPDDEQLLWIKQFGIIARSDFDTFQTATGVQGFGEYCQRLVRLMIRASENAQTDGLLLEYLRLLDTCLSDENLVVRLHNMMQLLWLKHADLYLTPRALNQFIGGALRRLQTLAQEAGSSKAEKSILTQALYESTLPSIYQAVDYGLQETCLHRSRNIERERKIMEQDYRLTSYSDRLRHRLSEYFDTKDSWSLRMLEDGILEEFMDDHRLMDAASDFIDSIALMRIDRSLLFRRESFAKSRPEWDFEKNLLAPKIYLYSEEREKKRRQTISFLIFDKQYDGVRIASPPLQMAKDKNAQHMYLIKREKIIRLNLRSNSGSILTEKIPSLRLTLGDFHNLKNIRSPVGTPDLSLSRSTWLRVNSFLSEIEGVVDMRIKPQIGRMIKQRIADNRLQGLMLLPLHDVTELPKLQVEGNFLLITLHEGHFKLGG